MSFQEYVSKEINHPVFFCDLVYKLKRVKGEANFISSVSKIEAFDVVSMTQRSSRLYVLCLALSQPCTDHSLRVSTRLTRRLGLYDGPCLNLLRGDRVLIHVRLIVSWDSFSLWTWARVAQPTYMDVPIYFWYKMILLYMFVYHIFITSAFVGCWSSVSIRRIIYKFLHVCPFDYTVVAVSGEVDRL